MSCLTFREMIRSCHRLRSKRSKWYTKWRVWAEVDWRWVAISPLPVIMWSPWVERYPGCAIIEIHWFALHIGIGEFNRREDVSTDNDV